MIAKKSWRAREGQTLIEILIGLGVAAIIIGGAVYSIVFTLSSGTENQKKQAATGLATELISQARTVADADWLGIYNLPSKGTSTSYYIMASGSILIATSGYKTAIVDNEDYEILFSLENVSRDVNDDVTESGGTDDPSTQKVTAKIRWPAGGTSPSEFSIGDYITRWRTRVFRQDDWSGGLNLTATTTETTTKISSSTDFIEIDAASGTIKLVL